MQPQKNASPEDVAARRETLRIEFLQAIGWTGVAMQAMQADASFRRYYRLDGAPTPALLMQDPPDRPPVPPYVMVEPFIAIAEHLRKLGLRAPDIFFKDMENGLLVLEDFGDDTYTRLFNAGADPKPLYELAVDVLVHLHKHPQRNDLPLKPYSDQVLVDEAMLLLDWYYPALTGNKPSDELKQSFGDVWRQMFKAMPGDQQTLVLRDYHVDNLMLAKDGEGIARCGLLDFQDALIGQFSYDLMSLLEDARRDVPKDLQDHLYDRYLKAMGPDLDRKGFDYAYRVLAAQRHAKVLGIFVRLYERDGKDRYLQFIPHVHKLFMQSVNDPALAPLKKWFDDNRIDIALPLKSNDKRKGPTP
jgi:aminoglycoside/choline kinase family phosphotransferase